MLKEKVEKALEKIRPYLQMDGGDVELVDVDERNGVVTVRLVGVCSGCPMASITLTHGIERVVKEEVPEVKKVVSTHDISET